MPLTETEWQQVRCLVRDHLVLSVEPRIYLAQFFAADLLGEVSFTNKASDNAVALVDWARNTDQAIRLLEVLASLDAVQVLPDHRHVKSYWVKLVQERAALADTDHFRVSLIPGTQEIFIDRHELRTTLRAFVENPSKFVLRVTGEPVTGKSYTWTLLQHLARPCGFDPTQVILDPGSTADDVIRLLAHRLAPGERNRYEGEEPAKRHLYSADWLVRKALEAARPWWLVLDDYNKLDPTSDVHDLVGHLALAIFNQVGGRAARSVPRLVLLGYAEEFPPLPDRLRRRICHDQASPVGSDELEAFFSQVFMDHHRSKEENIEPGLLAARVAVAVDAVLAAARSGIAGGGSFMREVGYAAEEVVSGYPSF